MPLVSIITRTKDRPVLLIRAMESIRSQTLKDYQWIIVNDGGSRQDIAAVTGNVGELNKNTLVIHNELSGGMEAASNIGLKRAQGKYIVIHDDDDSWECNFLEKTVGFLEENKQYMGVVTRAWMVEEHIEDDRVIMGKKIPFNPNLSSITLFQMAQLNNVPPPISFLYKREVLDKVGLYREELPVLGDWDFNLRFLRHYDIGVITEPLANYHVRKQKLQQEQYSNTVTSGINKHIEYSALLRNEYLRRDLEEHVLGFGFIVNLCHELEQIKSSINRTNIILKIKKLFKLVR